MDYGDYNNDLIDNNASSFNASDFLAPFADYMMYFFIALIVVTSVIFIIFFIRQLLKKRAYTKQVLYLVRLPKGGNEENEKKEFTTQEFREEVAKAETIFAAIGGLKAQKGFKAWWSGRDDHFSMEIVAHNKMISFYVSAPESGKLYLEQQIHAHYPEASIEEAEDYNIFNAKSEIVAAYLKTKNHFVLPLRTYAKDEVDPLNSVLNVMSKLNDGDGLAIQYLVRSAKKVWHERARGIVKKAYESNNLKEAFKTSGGSGSSFFGVIIDLLIGIIRFDWFSTPKKPETLDINKPVKRLTAMEEETLKGIEEKNSKAGLDVNLRIIVSSNSLVQAQSCLDNLINSYSQYNSYEYGNSFKNVTVTTNSSKNRLINDFIYRRFNDDISFLLNTEELASIYHFPLKNAETPNILWLAARQAVAPANLPTEGLIMGYNVFRGVEREIRIKSADRLRHMYVIGKSGTGKSVLLSNMAIQDAQAGHGFCVLDPHGDLVDDILSRIPPERAEDVIIFNPADIERPIGLNLLEYDERYPEQKTFVINEMIGIFDKLYDLKATGGPMFEQYMRNTMLLIMDNPETGSTLMEISKVLADENFRKMKLAKCKNQTVVDFWRKEADKAGGDAALANMVPYITSKLTPFISNDMMRPIIAQQKSAFNFRELMDSRKILLVKLPKGAIGEANAYLLGMIIVGKILMAALSRADMKKEDRKDFYLYIDEFQNFTTDSICQILSEARKYGLGLVIAHQYIGQLTKKGDASIKDAVFGNAGTMISFKVGVDDAEFLAKEMAPVFGRQDLINMGKGMACLKLLIDNTSSKPFSLQTPWPLFGVENLELAENMTALSRLKYGRDRYIIESEIKRRSFDLDL